MLIFAFYDVLSVPRQAGGHHGQLAQNYRARARPVRTIWSITFLFLYIKTREGRRVRFIFKNLISKLHEFVHETKCVLPVGFGGLGPDLK